METAMLGFRVKTYVEREVRALSWVTIYSSPFNDYGTPVACKKNFIRGRVLLHDTLHLTTGVNE